MRLFGNLFRLFFAWWNGIFGGSAPSTPIAPITTPTIPSIPVYQPTIESPITVPTRFETNTPVLPTSNESPLTTPSMTEKTVSPVRSPLSPIQSPTSTVNTLAPARASIDPVPPYLVVPSPTKSPTRSPISQAPVSLPKPDAVILINCAGPEYNETTASGLNRTWIADKYYKGGYVTESDPNTVITNTNHPVIYQTYRLGQFKYEIPIPIGNYEIIIHLAETLYSDPGYRIFDMNIEGKIFRDIDIVALSGNGQSRTAITISAVQLIDDGFVSIATTYGKSENPIICGIEILLVAPHLAHAVAGTGSYSAVDVDNVGVVNITVDGSASHTHGIGLVVTQWVWRDIKGNSLNNVVGTGVSPTISLSVGNHTISLTIVDSGGNESTDTTTISVYPFGYPAITKLIPDKGSIIGDELVQIIGSGFTFSADETIVHFGVIDLTGPNEIQIINATTILVRTPPTTVGAPARVTVETPLQISAPITYTYIASSEIKFQSGELFSLTAVTTGAFGPDGKLYLGTYYGYLVRLTLNENYTAVIDTLIVRISYTQRAILGIAFDPNEVGQSNPSLYFSTSQFFHLGNTSSSGLSINGKIQRASGANLEFIEDIITGLPVSDHDHGINGIEFGDSRELYIQLGGNTNGGVPGRISGSFIQKDNYYSSATLVAYIHKPGFNGTITYDADDDGNPNGGSGIEFFCVGNRNPFGLTLHSNGYLYGTDNGPNTGYGAMMTGCDEGMTKPDVKTQDKVDVLLRGNYYGHPNRRRAIFDNDTRQCVWKHPIDDQEIVDGKVTFKKPLVMMPSSITGIIEYTADHFDRQLRHNLIVVKYTSSLSRIILRSDGLGVIPQSNPALALGIGSQGLSITQAPDGTLIEIRYGSGKVFYHRAVEIVTSTLKVFSVFPRRGPAGGGYRLNVFGQNLDTTTTIVIVNPRLGNINCQNVSIVSPSILTCIMPQGDRGTTVNLQVSSNSSTYQYLRGFRYINGISR